MNLRIAGLALLFLCTWPLSAQKPAKAPKPAKTLYYLSPGELDLTQAIAPPPPQDSAATRAELADIHHLESTRTAAAASAAELDDKREDIFLYATILGPAFNATDLHLTFALSKHLRNDVSVVNGPLKARFGRPRPYNFDHTLHPICDTNQENSYPSGHAFNGYLYALTLTQLIPERSADILARADDYAHNRTVCEAHYASDLQASRLAAYALFGALLATPQFQQDLAAARTETRRAMQLDPTE